MPGEGRDRNMVSFRRAYLECEGIGIGFRLSPRKIDLDADTDALGELVSDSAGRRALREVVNKPCAGPYSVPGGRGLIVQMAPSLDWTVETATRLEAWTANLGVPCDVTPLPRAAIPFSSSASVQAATLGMIFPADLSRAENFDPQRTTVAWGLDPRISDRVLDEVAQFFEPTRTTWLHHFGPTRLSGSPRQALEVAVEGKVGLSITGRGEDEVVRRALIEPLGHVTLQVVVPGSDSSTRARTILLEHLHGCRPLATYALMGQRPTLIKEWYQVVRQLPRRRPIDSNNWALRTLGQREPHGHVPDVYPLQLLHRRQIRLLEEAGALPSAEWVMTGLDDDAVLLAASDLDTWMGADVEGRVTSQVDAGKQSPPSASLEQARHRFSKLLATSEVLNPGPGSPET